MVLYEYAPARAEIYVRTYEDMIIAKHNHHFADMYARYISAGHTPKMAETFARQEVGMTEAVFGKNIFESWVVGQIN